MQCERRRSKVFGYWLCYLCCCLWCYCCRSTAPSTQYNDTHTHQINAVNFGLQPIWMQQHPKCVETLQVSAMCTLHTRTHARTQQEIERQILSFRLFSIWIILSRILTGWWDEEFEYGKHCEERGSGSRSRSERVDIIRSGCGNTMIHFYFKSVILLLVVVQQPIYARMQLNHTNARKFYASRIYERISNHSQSTQTCIFIRPRERFSTIDFHCIPKARASKPKIRFLNALNWDVPIGVLNALVRIFALFSEWWRWNIYRWSKNSG